MTGQLRERRRGSLASRMAGDPSPQVATVLLVVLVEQGNSVWEKNDGGSARYKKGQRFPRPLVGRPNPRIPKTEKSHSLLS